MTFEPNGHKTFPDFRVGDCLIVETTRLEKSVQAADAEAKHHSQHHVRFCHAMEKTVEKMQPPRSGHDWAVRIRVAFPQKNREVQRRLAKFLDMAGKWPDLYEGRSFRLAEGLDVAIARGCESNQPQFYLGMITPTDLAGWVLRDTIDQINEAIARKAPKLRNYTGPFDEAWLAVGGGSSVGLSFRDDSQIQSALTKGSGWQKIVLLRGDRFENGCLFDV